jgi:hypothetical protein
MAKPNVVQFKSLQKPQQKRPFRTAAPSHPLGPKGGGVQWSALVFECSPSGICDHDAADFDRLVASLNGLALDYCMRAAKEAA